MLLWTEYASTRTTANVLTHGMPSTLKTRVAFPATDPDVINRPDILRSAGSPPATAIWNRGSPLTSSVEPSEKISMARVTDSEVDIGPGRETIVVAEREISTNVCDGGYTGMDPVREELLDEDTPG